ncbi:MAG TPA: alpha/beta hydrolase-fold protein [Flavisolibacter sp.]|jgi:enterochelin esterase family protein|nr:alpha/beta hydrolase-fold protein [Flavisolibacter sp.]
MKGRIFLLLFLGCLSGIHAQTKSASGSKVEYVPFEVKDDSSAVFRLYAPDAKSVTLGGDIRGVNSQKASDGVWTITTASGLRPSAYRYFFMVDGMKVNDPKNPMVADFRPMVEIVPKNQNLFWQQKNVPHGLLSIVFYESKATNSTRRMFVWTPPGYFSGNEKLPVLYLLHGGGDNDTNWPGQGKAGWILDNLFAEGKIVPMVVVMPDGSIPVEAVAEDIGNSIIPYVEKNFRVQTDATHRAIAGLSMGGLQTMETILKFPDRFTYVNVMGSGWWSDRPGNYEKYDALVKAAAPQLKKTVKYFIFNTGGPSDIADKNNDLTKAVFDKYGVKSSVSKMEGGHTMYVWRHDLYNFAQKIFK